MNFKNGKLKAFLQSTAGPIAKDILGQTKVGKVYNVVKDLITGDSKISEEDKIDILAEAHDHDQEILKLENEDRVSSRDRQTLMAQLGKFDLLYYVTGLGGMAAFGFIIYALVYLTIPEGNSKLFIHLVGIIEGVVITVFAFFFGGTRKSS